MESTRKEKQRESKEHAATYGGKGAGRNRQRGMLQIG
jgi:hypothetical protein